jgi:hypothetical protein
MHIDQKPHASRLINSDLSILVDFWLWECIEWGKTPESLRGRSGSCALTDTAYIDARIHQDIQTLVDELNI